MKTASVFVALSCFVISANVRGQEIPKMPQPTPPGLVEPTPPTLQLVKIPPHHVDLQQLFEIMRLLTEGRHSEASRSEQQRIGQQASGVVSGGGFGGFGAGGFQGGFNREGGVFNRGGGSRGTPPKCEPR